jgi:hypothetical protein
LDELEEAKQWKQPPPRECLYFIKGAVNYLVPVLTEAMTKGVRLFYIIDTLFHLYHINQSINQSINQLLIVVIIIIIGVGVF